MLHILTGRAGSGKTTQVLRRMREAGERRPQLLLVPEQASFETERRFCRENGNQAGRYGEVLSFTRLENRVLSLGGGAAEPVLDAGGRLLVLYAALRSVQANLTVYAMPSQKPAFLTSLLTTLDELKSYCITGEQLTQVGEETEGMDGEKLRDLGLIFGAYEAMTARGALDPRDRLTRLAEKLRRFPFFQGQDVYLDGFTDFTPQQGLVLAELLRQAHSVTLALTYGEGAGEEAVFAPARKTLAWIKGLAAKVGCPVEEEALPAGEWERTPPLRHLEQALFAHPMPPYTGPWDGSIVVHELPSPREEVAWAAGEIRALVRQGRVRYRDIVVTARSMDPYWEQLEGVFAQYDIPLFQADKTDLLQKPLFTLITAALDAVNGGYLYEDMFRYLKTGLAGLSLPECDQLENYVLTWDIWGSRWTGAGGWTRHPGGYHQRFTPQDEETLETLNALRLRVIQPLERLRKNAGGTIGEQVLALYQFLEEIHAPEHLEARSAALLHQGEPELARQYSQLWEIFCRALEQCAALLGEVEAEFADFSRLLRLLLSQYSVGTIPASLDRVTAGDAQRLGGRACKVLFLLGAEDGAIPQVAPGQGLLTDQDRLLLEDYGLTCSPRLEEKISRENTIVYTTCAQPTERLCVTWPFQGAGGGEKRPSFLVERLNRLFPAAAAQGGGGALPGSAACHGGRTAPGPTGSVGRSPLRHAVSPPGSGGPLDPGKVVGGPGGGAVRGEGGHVGLSDGSVSVLSLCLFPPLRPGGKGPPPSGVPRPGVRNLCPFRAGNRAAGGSGPGRRGTGLPGGGPGLHGPGGGGLCGPGTGGDGAPDPPLPLSLPPAGTKCPGGGGQCGGGTPGFGFPAGAF